MGRRSKAKMYDLVNRIIFLYENEKLNIKEIESLLRSEGYDISKSSIHRTIKTHQELALEYKKIAEETKGLIEALKENPATDLMEAVHTILTNKIFEFVRQIETIDFDDPVELTQAVSRLSKSLESLQKYREERLQKAMENIEKEAQKRNIDPEFLQILRKEIYGQ